LRTALTWFEEQEDWSRALRLASAMGGFWFARAYLAEGRDWLQRLLAHREGVPPVVVADALRVVALLALFLGDLHVADAALEDALSAGSNAGEDRGRCWTLFLRGVLAEFSGDDNTAETRYQEALAIARDRGDLAAATVALTCLGDCAYRRSDLELATALTNEAAVVARRGRLTFYLVFALTTAGYVALARDELASSVRVFGEGLAHIGRLTNTFYTADNLAGVASVALAAGQPERATRLLGAVAALCERTGLTVLAHDTQQQHTTILLREALSDGAFATAWAAGRALTLEAAVAEAKALTDELTTDAAA
jgi:non-specific serine/threonine protein kinase